MGQAEIQEAAPPSPASNTLDRAHLSALSGVVCPLADGGAAWLHDGSCMSREAHVQFCERLGVRFPGATHPGVIAWVARYQGKWFNSGVTKAGRVKNPIDEEIQIQGENRSGRWRRGLCAFSL